MVLLASKGLRRVAGVGAGLTAAAATLRAEAVWALWAMAVAAGVAEAGRSGGPAGSGQVEGAGLLLGVALIDDDAVLQPAIGTQFLVNGPLKLLHVMLFEKLVEIRARHLNQKHIIMQLHRHDGLKPRAEALLTNR